MSRFKQFLLNEKKEETPTLVLGRHNGTQDDVDPKQLKMGIKVEMEHVPDGTSPSLAKEIARRITLDHLAENAQYYSLLKKFVESKNDGPEDAYK